MDVVRKKVMLGCGVLATLTLVVQWSGLPGFLDQAIGVSGSAPLVAFLKENTQGLVIMVGFALYMELIGLEKPDGRKRQEKLAALNIIEQAVKASSSRALLQHSLREQYGDEAAKQFICALFRSSAEMRNFSVGITVERGMSGGLRTLHSYSYESSIERYLIATATDPLHAESLLSADVFSEVFVGEDFAHVPFTVKCKKTDSHGVASLHSLEFREMGQCEKARLLRENAISLDSKKCKIFEGYSENLKINGGDRVLYMVERRAVLPDGASRVYWKSDRILYVKELVVDLSNLGKDIYDGARVYTFIAALQWSADVVAESGVWVFPLETHLVPGQGCMVAWQTRQ